MADDVSICNLALQKLGAGSITSLSDDSVAARECNRVYDHLRDVELRSHPWGFAKSRAQIAASATSPAFGYARAFPLPSDFLRIHWDITDMAASDGLVPRDWSIERHEGLSSIMTDDDAPLDLVYVARIEDVNSMDILFQESLASRIAMTICEKVTQSNSKRELAANEYRFAITEAKRVNAIESPPDEQREDPWLIARR